MDANDVKQHTQPARNNLFHDYKLVSSNLVTRVMLAN